MSFSGLTEAARVRVRQVREAVLGRRDPSSFYLVSPAGVPNFGDEFLTRAWLDWLSAHHPDAEVWLDCIEPGRASHLFADTHPRLRVTNTLWQLAHLNPAGELATDAQRAAGAAIDLGTPQLDLGLDALRRMTSIHLLGGGYLNSLWPLNLTMLSALAAVKETYGVPVFATGQGLLPQTDETSQLVRPLLERFDYVESRDAEGAELFAVEEGIDDAFLAFANVRPVFAEYETPDVMVLLQGDFFGGDSEGAVREAIRKFARTHGPDKSIGFVEARPPDDARFVDADPQASLFPFMRIWEEGVPARPGQTWLSSRFHFHFLAAAAGARGVAVSNVPGYYDVKHASMQRAGSGWPVVGAQDLLEGSLPVPDVDSAFSESTVARLATQKAAVAKTLYG
jgi:hypothetical protein